ncbi:MAG TPA: LLM class flavin-dependent oxidoreductase [Roseiflexaceae bacterium]|nr:LLM class flavin-dependent oxidoreductase [Roseiflexaceae bacterium]
MDQSAMRPLKVGVFLPFAEYMMDRQTPRWTDLLTMTQRAEALAFDSVWLGDHLLARFPEPQDWLDGHTTSGAWDCWSLLAALAAVTKRIELGPLVSCTSFHNPTLLAKKAATVEEISGGRLVLGLGAGWMEPEYHAFGYPFDHRVSRFEEAFTIIRTLLREGQINFEGTYYQARECELRPRGPRSAGPPLLIGSVSPRMLRLMARHADQWNGWIPDRSRVGEVAPLRSLVDAACEEVGRDPATVERTLTISVNPTEHTGSANSGILCGSPEILAEELRAFAREGISHIQIAFQPMTLASIEEFAPTLELLDQG